jgi:hypothetical protein
MAEEREFDTAELAAAQGELDEIDARCMVRFGHPAIEL